MEKLLGADIQNRSVILYKGFKNFDIRKPSFQSLTKYQTAFPYYVSYFYKYLLDNKHLKHSVTFLETICDLADIEITENNCINLQGCNEPYSKSWHLLRCLLCMFIICKYRIGLAEFCNNPYMYENNIALKNKLDKLLYIVIFCSEKKDTELFAYTE